MEKPPRPCGACGVSGAPLRCPCKGESYCNKKCQKESWLEHRLGCTVYLTAQLEETRVQFGHDTNEVALASIALGSIFAEQGHLRDAERLVLQGEQISRSVNPYLHPMTADAVHCLGIVCFRRGKYTDALKHLKDGLKIRCNLFGRDHLEVADSFSSIGNVYTVMAKHEKAWKRYEEELRIYRICHGNEHSDVAKALCNLGNTCHECGDIDGAMVHFTEALRICRALDHDLAIPLVYVAQILATQGKLEEALAHLAEVLPIIRKSHGEKSPQTATVLYSVAEVYLDQGKLHESLKLHKKVRHCVGFRKSIYTQVLTVSGRLFIKSKANFVCNIYPGAQVSEAVSGQ